MFDGAARAALASLDRTCHYSRSFVVVVVYVIIILHYNTLSEVAKALSPIEVATGISLSILGIAIGLVVAYFNTNKPAEWIG